MSLKSVVLFALGLTLVAAATNYTAGTCQYKSNQNWKGWNFFDQFDFFTSGDPTHGFVQFVDRGTAQNSGLISVNNNGQVYMGVDNTNKVSNGRRAVRLQSKNQYSNGLIILDLAHMPGSVCGSWPAFWTVGANWPNQGEVDIIEQVNANNYNQVTLHTNNGCQMNVGRSMSGTALQNNCDVVATGNAGCGVKVNSGGSYGSGFNSQGGGVYAMERTDSDIRIWYFAKNNVPSDLRSANPNPCGWGAPVADFPLGGNCNKNHFGAHNIVFDITFCGDWAAAVFGQTCPNKGSCNDYVGQNPAAFKETYWLINSLRILNK